MNRPNLITGTLSLILSFGAFRCVQQPLQRQTRLSELQNFKKSEEQSCQKSGYSRTILNLHSASSQVSLFGPNVCNVAKYENKSSALNLQRPVQRTAPNGRPTFILIDVMGNSDVRAIEQTRVQQILEERGITVHRVVTDGSNLDDLDFQLQQIGVGLPAGTQIITSVSGHGGEFSDLNNPAVIAGILGNGAAGSPLATGAVAGGLEQGHTITTTNGDPVGIAQIVGGLMFPPSIASAATTIGVGKPESPPTVIYTRDIVAVVADRLPQSASSLVLIDSCNAGAGVNNYNHITGANGQPINVIGATQNGQFASGAFAETLATAYGGDRNALDNLRQIAGPNGELTLADIQRMNLPNADMPARPNGERVLSTDPQYTGSDNFETIWAVDFARLVTDDGGGARIEVPQNPIVLSGNENLLVFDLGPGPNPQANPNPGPDIDPNTIGSSRDGGNDTSMAGSARGPGTDSEVSPGEAKGDEELSENPPELIE